MGERHKLIAHFPHVHTGLRVEEHIDVALVAGNVELGAVTSDLVACLHLAAEDEAALVLVEVALDLHTKCGLGLTTRTSLKAVERTVE